MVFSNVIVDITIFRRPFVFSQSHVQISASLTDVRGVAVATSLLLFTALCLSLGSSLSLTFVKSCRKVVIIYSVAIVLLLLLLLNHGFVF